MSSVPFGQTEDEGTSSKGKKKGPAQEAKTTPSNGDDMDKKPFLLKTEGASLFFCANKFINGDDSTNSSNLHSDDYLASMKQFIDELYDRMDSIQWGEFVDSVLRKTRYLKQEPDEIAPKATKEKEQDTDVIKDCNHAALTIPVSNDLNQDQPHHLPVLRSPIIPAKKCSTSKSNIVNQQHSMPNTNASTSNPAATRENSIRKVRMMDAELIKKRKSKTKVVQVIATGKEKKRFFCPGCGNGYNHKWSRDRHIGLAYCKPPLPTTKMICPFHFPRLELDEATGQYEARRFYTCPFCKVGRMISVDEVLQHAESEQHKQNLKYKFLLCRFDAAKQLNEAGTD